MAVADLLVDVRGVSKRYGAKRALDDVELRVSAGEVVGLVGPNGAGKSTLLRTLCGMSACDVGHGHVLGCPVGNLVRSAPFVGLMIERPSFIEGLDGRTNLRLLAGIRKEIGAERIDEVLELVGLARARRAPVRQYSLGMRQRLSLAQAIMERPRLLVLDEPTNGLDPDGILEMRGLLRKLAMTEGLGVLLSTHLLGEAESACDRVVLIAGGRIRGEFRAAAGARDTVRLELGDPRQVGVVAALAGVEGVRAPGDGRGLEIDTAMPVPRLVCALVAAGVEVEAVYRYQAGLEQVYREVLGSAT